MTSEIDAVVIGAGVSGLSAAHALRRLGARVIVLERELRPGGVIESERTPEGFLVEHGPDGILSSKPAGMHLIHSLQLDDELISGGRAPRRAYVGTRKGRLERVPEGLFRFERKAALGLLSSPLLSLGAKARLFFEPFVPAGDPEHESVQAFFSRRLGPEVASRIVDPLMRGVYGAPTASLGMAETMPTIAAMEKERGSLAAALMGPRATSTAGLVTLRDGMGTLVEALTESIGGGLVLGRAARSLSRTREGFRVELGRGGELVARAVIMACPAWAAAPLVERLSPELAQELSEIPYSPADIVSLGFARSEVPHPLDATGFVVSPDAGRRLVGCTWSSEKWHHRAPDERALFRAILTAPDAEDAELVSTTRADLRDFMGIEAEPGMVRVRRRRRALPVHGVGHRARVSRVRALSASLGRFALAGNAYSGMGVPDCIASGLAAATAVSA